MPSVEFSPEDAIRQCLGGPCDGLIEERIIATAWRQPAEQAISHEDACLLSALTIALKPAFILESGSGYSTLAFVHGLDIVGAGRLVSVETNADWAAEVRAHLVGPVRLRVNVGGIAAWRGETPDIVFLDSAQPVREREITRWLSEPVLLIVHDANRSDSTPELPDDGWRVDTPQGLWMRDWRPRRFERR